MKRMIRMLCPAVVAALLVMPAPAVLVSENPDPFQAQMERIGDLQEQGRLEEADALVKKALAGEGLTADQQAALNFELERSRRIRGDYTLSEDELFEALKDAERGIPDLTREEFDAWVREGRFDMKTIGGERRFFSPSRSNLFFRWPELRARKAKPAGTEYERFLLKHVREIKAAWRRDAQITVPPHRFWLTMRISVDAGAVPEGETIRCWMPYAQQFSAQGAVELLEASPEPLWMNAPTWPQRSLYFEQPSRGAEPTVFEATWEMSVWPRWTPLDPARVAEATQALAGGFADPAAAHFLEEQPPHVVFTPEILRLEAEIAGTETNPCIKARRYYDWISRNIKYSFAREYSTLRNISMYVYNNRYGDCGQIALLFITLCRAGGVPARWQSGWMLYPMNKNLHDWTEIYLEPYGWIPVDPNHGVETVSVMEGLTDEERAELRDFYFGGMDAYRLVVNRDHGFPHFPPKRDWRSDTVDFQRGELETAGGKNIYFDQFSYRLTVEELPPPSGK
ncbi:MAG: transglutaminase domain-containing protein [Candidatus Sumerlaeia bacterium]